MDYRIFNVGTDVNACDCTQGCTDTVREFVLKVDSGRKIPCRTEESILRQRRAGRKLYQLSYIPTPCYIPAQAPFGEHSDRQGRSACGAFRSRGLYLELNFIGQLRLREIASAHTSCTHARTHTHTHTYLRVRALSSHACVHIDTRLIRPYCTFCYTV